MDEGKGGQTRSLQEREGENRNQSANLGTRRNGKEKKKTGSESAGPGQFWPGMGAGEGGGWAGQKAHDGGLGDGVAEASRALSRVGSGSHVSQWWRYCQ